MQTLTRDELRSAAPSVFNATRWEGMSDRYRLIPTIEVVDILRDRGFLPVLVAQSRSRIAGKQSFARHMIRFRHTDYLNPATVGEELPELVLSNSHDGSAAYRFNSGVFRMVCTNGMVVASADFGGISVKHSGGDSFHERIIDATFRIIEETPRTMETIEAWKQIELTPPQANAFASAAVELLDKPVEPAQLLAPRREEDAKPDLWHTFNRAQEAILKGGVKGHSATGRQTTTRPVKAVERDIRLNKALWTLASKLAETIG